jgi:hypothetical protein
VGHEVRPHRRRDGAPSARDVEADLLPAIERVGATIEHVVTFHEEAHASMLAELSSRGHRIAWDLVMDHAGDPAPAPDVEVEALSPDEVLWALVRDSFALFGLVPGAAAEQLLALERDIRPRGQALVRDQGPRRHDRVPGSVTS